jgi:hypothetical protein
MLQSTTSDFMLSLLKQHSQSKENINVQQADSSWNETDNSLDVSASYVPPPLINGETTKPLAVFMHIRDQLDRNGLTVLSTVLTLQYQSHVEMETSSSGSEDTIEAPTSDQILSAADIDLEIVLIAIFNRDESASGVIQNILASAIGSEAAQSLSISFRPFMASTVASYQSDDDYCSGLETPGKQSADTGLIVACSLLAVLVVATASVLLYITGGWDEIQQRLSNCLFEEVEDEYIIHHKNSMTSQSSGAPSLRPAPAPSMVRSGANNNTSEDVEKAMSHFRQPESLDERIDTDNLSIDERSTATTPTGTGHLGVSYNLAMGLGIKTPGSRLTGFDDENESYPTPHGTMSDMTMTPARDHNSGEESAHLGIHSMRKMPREEAENNESLVPVSLANMIMSRVRYATGGSDTRGNRLN